MADEFRVPKLGENVDTIKVISVLVKEGETIEEGQPVVEVETDKATVEIPSEVAGKVAKVHVAEGDELEEDAVEEMKKHGLKVNPVPPGAVEEWKELFEKGRQQSGKNLYSQDFMDRLQEIIREYRNGVRGDQ